jgi:LAO/AO transport system kinase
MKKDDLGRHCERLLSKAQDGNLQCLAKLLSVVEKELFRASSFLATLNEKPTSIRLGITGPPGAGKSTLINVLVGLFRKAKLRVAILAVDPSSPFSGGAILGDRIRMTSHSEDDGVFIRSLGSRGGIGGLSAATGAMAAILEAANFDIIIIETVGVGQTEIQVMNLADITTVVLVPESGDVIQTMKAGILEVADIFVVNKADRPGAEVLAKELEALVHSEKVEREIYQTASLTGKGVESLASELVERGLELKKERRNAPERLRGHLKSLIMWVVQENLEATLEKKKIKNIYEAFEKFKIPK